MKAGERNIQQLLHSSDQYVIPAFQRYYTWGAKNWDELLDDIAELLAPDDEHRRHFLGAIVTVPESHQPGKVTPYQVIDGQQRLTTLSILLAVIRDSANDHGWEELGAEIDENYLIHRFKKDRERYKIFPRMRDRPNYLALVDRKKEGATGQIGAAYQYFRKHVDTNHAASEGDLRGRVPIVVGDGPEAAGGESGGVRGLPRR